MLVCAWRGIFSTQVRGWLLGVVVSVIQAIARAASGLFWRDTLAAVCRALTECVLSFSLS